MKKADLEQIKLRCEAIVKYTKTGHNGIRLLDHDYHAHLSRPGAILGVVTVYLEDAATQMVRDRAEIQFLVTCHDEDHEQRALWKKEHDIAVKERDEAIKDANFWKGKNSAVESHHSEQRQDALADRMFKRFESRGWMSLTDFVDDRNKLLDLCHNDKKIAAIKYVREQTLFGLKRSKDAVESLMAWLRGERS